MNKKELLSFPKNRNNLLLLIILISGIALMTFSGTGTKKESQSEDTVKTDAQREEARLEKILEKIENAGSVSVMISYEETAKKNIAYERSKSGFSSESAVSQESAVMADGEPLVINERYPSVRGVLVVAQGAGDPKTKRALAEAVEAVLGVDAHRIKVYSGAG